MTSHGHGPALCNRMERTQMKQGLRMFTDELLAVLLNDLRQLVLWLIQPMR